MQTQTSDPGQAGVVSKKAPGYYDVHLDGQVISCTLSSKLGKDFQMTCLPGGRGQRVQSVTDAVMDGQINPYRYKSYLRLKADL